MLSSDFLTADFTAIVSDLHLCEAEPVHPKYPLWKKFKTRQFFFDDMFKDFLNHIQEKSGGKSVELILNGDIFDFDSVMTIPESPTFRIHWLEHKRGLFPRPERSKYKIQKILQDHTEFVDGLRQFVLKGNRIIFIIGNHDLELHFPEVQDEVIRFLNLPANLKANVRVADWFYISNRDTLIEHGNQYDPYCTCEDPVNPFSQEYNHKNIRLPFGNLACRYLVNGMGFFNPHVDSNYIMSMQQYAKFFLKYMIRAQPELMLTWLGGAIVTLWHSFKDQLSVPLRDPMKIEDRINQIAEKANAEPRMVRELRELFAQPAATNPFLVAKELWLDRAFLILVTFFVIAEAMILINQMLHISFFWAFIPLFLLLPFFLFYSKSVVSMVSSFKEPEERALAMAGAITKVSRIVFGHTHQFRHEMIGPIEHLNSGTWSPAFFDVECTKSVDQKTFVWIEPDANQRKANLLIFKDGESKEVFHQVRERPKR